MDYGPWTIDQFMKDNFSNYADKYARYRPGYPDSLFEYIYSLAKDKILAWDCGTGNGQSAIHLAKYFKEVYATDISSKQLDNAVRSDNIKYVPEPAERTSLENNSIDLITVSQALHWFNFPLFYAEVKRVAKENAIIAVWTYSLLKIDPVIDNIIETYHFGTLKDHWDPERKYVDDGYANIPFPFKQIQSPSFQIEMNWSREDLEGYINTWSATQKFIASKNFNPVTGLMEKINGHWGAGKRQVVFPIHFKAGFVH